MESNSYLEFDDFQRIPQGKGILFFSSNISSGRLLQPLYIRTEKGL